ncbi:P2Y purinoceptor 1-like [Salarias fasciatus]|nr:P2Y purinoceptor 1-like [Salarias fasciatus]
MNNTTCIDDRFPGKFLPAVYISVLIVGLFANGMGMKSLLHNWQKVGDVKIFMLNLGLADVLYLLTLPFLIVYHFNDSKWIFGEIFCKVTRFGFNLNFYGSIGFLTCISMYRYLAIVHPLRVMGRITVTHSVLVSLVVWLLVSAQSVPDMFFMKTSRSNTNKCFETTTNEYVEDYLNYRLGWTLTGFCLPFLITVGCYGHAIAVLFSKDTLDKVLKQRCLKLLFVLIILFSVCYIPFHVLKNLNLWSRVLTKQKMCPQWSNGVYIAHQISRGLACLNSALNPLVYLHINEDISSQLRELLQRIHLKFSRKPTANPQAIAEKYTQTLGMSVV